MSDDRFDRIEQRLDRLETGQTELRIGIDELHTSAAETNARLDEVQGTVNELRTSVDETRRHMGVLHEAALDRIAAVAEGFPRLEAVMDRKFAEFTEAVGRRLDPLEAVVREHSSILRRHDVEIVALKRRRK